MSLDVYSHIVVGEKLIPKKKKVFEIIEYEDVLVLEKDRSIEICDDELYCDIFWDFEVQEYEDASYVLHGIKVCGVDIENTVQRFDILKIQTCCRNFYNITDRNAEIFLHLDYCF